MKFFVSGFLILARFLLGLRMLFLAYSGKYRDAMPDEYMDTPVTLRHLLSHTSGIPHHDQIWKSGKFNLQFRPGSQTLYSTRGYGILGKVLCEITGVVLMGRRNSSDGSQLFPEFARELMQHYKSQIVY
jgi:hypothetical protein